MSSEKENNLILVAGAGSGIGKSVLENLNLLNQFAIGVSRTGEVWKPSNDFEPGKNFQCNLSRQSEVLEFVTALKKRAFSLAGVYFTFGSGLFKPVGQIALEEWNAHFVLNLNSLFLLTKEILPLLKPGSFLCYLSSTAGYQGFSNSTAYCASRHAIAGFAKALREELKSEGIRVITVYPGAVYTEIWRGREGFEQEDMIPVDDFGKWLATLSILPDTVYPDEIHLLPRKGIL
ncbi:oxidoreductase, short chain dehydrogenase/reductase family protein [Leptospira weilii str. 2006001853]|uniref:Oxidoreductase, short chain dehydrogenase/reductase family protein n=1 Tax=Leptospira weilii str. 2006001853 TaxID=1001589 RepID=A0A828YX55_9LEPT|nr:SDR family oxidoreductase [Leptospira weilii]EKR62596.1 oxidoreductase, short chain dehydrogenase/reductase family protein [Leptospira weilii str. 2006001853]EMN42944.1 oxidoreductase, short chain dehydrogenase/reductase family protein [Leptospira weilii str. LNT 1234]ULH26951.1 SDR family oxidoreductase [Leptospira weilii]UPY80574.1 SDR family oxidoreductase [Leptospira weilii]